MRGKLENIFVFIKSLMSFKLFNVIVYIRGVWFKLLILLIWYWFVYEKSVLFESNIYFIWF